ncbi:hypothetical protein SAMN03159341_1044 [Paenibacillus sp. 1_12]|uniref:hypothetical protein n=1 Tax=Paenibacillus sp. 1_12 TaxID=1566278 RepID=UPI0008F16048|nr:hypothetical protein [Paenibacillus sp. 1_12]SFL20694.1 hypothetical protein SAMN03159341_1044 [Paenibacillus sp. 1_12]
MKLASFYKNSLVPTYERVNVLSKATIAVIETLQDNIPDPELVDDSRPFVRRQDVMNAILKAVNHLPKDWRMSARKKRAGGNFNYVVVHFEDLNLNLIPIHLLSYSKLPKPSRYRGDISAFNLAVMKDRGMVSDLEFQTHFNFDNETSLVTEPDIPSNIKDIPFGLFLIYDGTNAKAPIRLAALTPDQERYIFCDNIELLKEYSQSNEIEVETPIEMKKQRKLKLETSQVKEYQDVPNVVIKKDRVNRMSDEDANTI